MYGGREPRENHVIDSTHGLEWSHFYKALVPKTRLGRERRLSRSSASEMALPALPTEDIAVTGPVSTSPPRAGLENYLPKRRLSRQSGDEPLSNFMKRETGDHYFYKAVLNFLDGQSSAVYEFQVSK